MSAKLGTFSGANVFLSRNLVPPEIFDAIHDALRLNGAHVFLCCDPSRTAPDDYHVISSSDHEKFADLKARGCNLVGPQCIFSCAKEHRMLPKRGYTCCIAMDGVKVLASGFDKEERTMIEKLVIAMGGVLQTKTSMDVNFVIVKNVLAAKYKWALHVLKKPVVSMSWLCQCWIEHRVVPQEPYKVLPFMGLTICVTRIPVDKRKEIASLIVQNGGKYSADLTKNCSHLVSDAPAGDKYVVAKRWGHIRIVGRKWIEQSISKRACLDERLYPVHENFSSGGDAKFLQKEQSFQEPSNITSQLVPPSTIDDEEAASSLLDISVSENCITKNDVVEGRSISLEDNGTGTNLEQMGDFPKFDCRVAPDSDEDYDYLSNCRIFLAGFEGKELRRLVNMIRNGGGTRHVFLSARLTHIIIGTPSEAEIRELRPLVAWGAFNVVNAAWLEESDKAKRELPVSSRHKFSILKVSKEAVPVTENKISTSKLLSNKKQGTNESSIITNDSTEVASRCKRPRLDSIKKSNLIDERKLNSLSTVRDSLNSNETFKGKSFCFSSSFPIEHRVEVIEWVKGGGGMMLDDHAKNSDFIIESHGLSYVVPTNISPSTAVSTHWIRTSLEECCIQDASDHILYSPLHCHIPLPGIEGLCFCVSQYEGKERILLRNLCFVLGAKFTEKLTKKVTHLLCKFTSGPKYDAACRKGIQTVTAEWIAACVSQDKLVPPDSFQPRPVTSEDKEAGLCTESQYPTQAADMICFTSQSQNAHRVKSQNSDQPADVSSNSKIPEGDVLDGSHVMKAQQGKCKAVPDVADAIEDFLAQTDTNKIQDLPSAAMSGGESNIYAPDQANIGKNQEKSHAASSLSGTNNKLKRTKKQDKSTLSRKKARNSSGPYEPFSETQTESQVVGYEEDLSGRQKIIERIRSQSFTLTPDIR